MRLGFVPQPIRFALFGLIPFSGVILWWLVSPWAGLLAAGITAFLVIVLVNAYVQLPAWLVAHDTADSPGGSEFEERASAVNAARSTVVQVGQWIIGLVALAGIVVAWQQLRSDREQLLDAREQSRIDRQQVSTQLKQVSTQLILTRQGQVAERFAGAVEQLGSGKLEQQLGGIYGLERIAKEFDSNRLLVFEVLTAYVRQHARQEEADPATPLDFLEVRKGDVHAAMTVLARREVRASDPPLNLRRVDLRKADLQYANLQRAYLDGAWLQGANLNWAELQDARLFRAQLQGTRLVTTQLEAVKLKGAQYDAKTLWPDGFDPKAAGVELQQQ